MQALTDISFWDRQWGRKRKSGFPNLSRIETKRILSLVLDKVSLDSRILELGIAPGRMAEYVHELRPDLTIDGIDSSKKGIEIANQVFSQTGIKGTLFLEDLRSAAGLEERYDMVWSNGLIEHFERYWEIIQRHFGFAKSGGWVFIAIPNYRIPIVKKLLTCFSNETLQTHNLHCMNEAALSNAVSKDATISLETGRYGGSVLPHASFNSGIAGVFYNRVCQLWNFSIALISLVTNNKICIRLWDKHLYLLARKK
jgi:2-polyprenyl-3-methyl-5-hydroxy-6-metoxy-1,4-benzoquinol methylase